MRKRALVLSAETPSAVATVRGLHDAGFDVVVLAKGMFSPAALSWRCTKARATGTWSAAQLLRETREVAPDVVVPVTEVDLVRLAPVRAELEMVAPVLAPRADLLDTATDKGLVSEIAALAGVRVPEEARLEAGSQLEGAVADDFPCVAKPSRSKVLTADGKVWSGTAKYVPSPLALRKLQTEHSVVGLDTLIQRPLPGVGVGVSLLLAPDPAAPSDPRRAEPALVFAHRRVREARPDGGPSACAVSIAPEPGLVIPAIRAARALGLVGMPVQCEFRIVAGEEPVLLDVNPRPWGSLALSLDCGLNFVGLAAAALLGEPLGRTAPPYREGVLRHYLPFEVRHMLAVLFGSAPEGFRGQWPRGLAPAFGWFYGPHEGMVGRVDDPLPAFADAFATVLRAVRL